MKTMITRSFLLVLALILCVGLFACGDPTEPGETPDGETPGGSVGDDVENRVEPEVPDKMYNTTFNVLHYDVEGWLCWDEIVPSTGMEQRPGDLLGNDVFDRANWLQENYGIELTNQNQAHDGFSTMFSGLMQSGSTEYQLVDYFTYGAQGLIGRDYFTNLNDEGFEYINFENPWWVDSAIENYSIGNYIEFAVSDMLLLDKGATAMVFYNIQLATDLGVTGLYDDIDNYEWTMSRMAEYAELAWVSGDLNGDDVWDYNDRFGIITGDDPVHNLYIGSGNRFMAFDEETEEFYYSYGSSDETTDVMLDILTDIMYQDFFFNSWLRRNDAELPKFENNQALFTFGKAKACVGMRDMVADYGILPVPLYSEDQEQYYSQVSSYGDSIIAVPYTNVNNKEMIGAALELLGYYSYYEIYPDLFEVVIQGRGTRDQESKEMLDLIFSNRVYDMGLLYDPDHLTDKILRITEKQTTGVASHWDGLLNEREDTLKELNELYKKYNNP